MTSVAVGILRKDQSVLLCQRAEGGRYALYWEFPGGKVEPGESPEQALERELHEELSISAVVGELYHEQESFYSDGGVFSVRYYIVDVWDGNLHNNVFNDIRWVQPEEFSAYMILEGNNDVCTKLQLSTSKY